jgi:hypothetical protein
MHVGFLLYPVSNLLAFDSKVFVACAAVLPI